MLRNAAKYTPPGGPIHLGRAESGAVRDNGAGVLPRMSGCEVAALKRTLA
jgi:signal transduction histidine kinase